MKKLILIPVLVLFALISLSDANAVVRVVDTTGTATADFPAFTTDTVDTVSGNNPVDSEDYSLLFCSTENVFDGSNSFNPPSPNGWTELDNESCDFAGCSQGIWGKFTDTASNIPTNCTWIVPQNEFVGGTIRYADVDRNDPIIDIACQGGTGDTATAPSIVTEPGSHVVRTASFSVAFGFECEIEAEEITVGGLNLCANSEIGNISINALSITDLEGGPTGEATLDLPSEEADWRACTIALRMAVPGPKPIPTMSEWGFMAVAVFMGAAGVWYLRRRQAQSA